MDSAREAIAGVVRLLRERGYEQDTPRCGAEALLVRRGRSLGPFLPYVDFIFLFDLDADVDPRSLERHHAEARAYAESRFDLPRVLRYRIPNTVSVGVTTRPVPGPTREFVRTPLKAGWEGGERNSALVLDLSAGELVSSGLMETPLRYGGTTTTSVNPTNRVARMMNDVFATLNGDVPTPDGDTDRREP